MKIITDFSEEQYSTKNNLYLFFAGISLSIIFIFFLYFGLSEKMFILLLGFVVCLIFLFSSNTTYYFFLTLIFLPYIYILRIHPAVVFSGFLLFSTIFNIKVNIWNKSKNHLWFPLFVYFISTLPSFVNTSEPLLSLRDFSNLISLFIVFFVTIHLIESIKKMKGVFYFFIVAVLFHSLIVIYLGVTSNIRAFGLLGVYYIDFAGLGSVLTFILFIYIGGIKKIFAGLAFILITFGLILTQTRNAWISFGFALVTLMIFLIFKWNSFYVKRKLIGSTLFILILIIGILFIFAGSFNSKMESRIDLTNQSVITDDPESVATNSFVSRVLIWHTAVIAFLEHPIIGIGVYSFKHTSEIYYKIPKVFYKLYVEGRTPHITYLQVLTETGIVGLIAFIFFISRVVREIRNVLSLKKTKEETMISLMISWSLLYIVFSMFMTESWLYGQYIAWIGVLLGCLVNISRIPNTKNVSE